LLTGMIDKVGKEVFLLSLLILIEKSAMD